MNTQRWYDKDPTISLAVSIIRNTSIENQIKVSTFIIEKIEQMGQEQQKSKKSIFGFFSKRWYDKNEKIFEALEKIKSLPLHRQREVSIQAINYLCTIDKSIDNSLL